MKYKKQIKIVKSIPNATTTDIINNRKILCKIYATQKDNQKKLADLIKLLGMNQDSKNFLINAVKQKGNNKNVPDELKEFIDTLENYSNT